MQWTTITSKGRSWDGRFKQQMLWIILDDGEKAVLYSTTPAPITGNNLSQKTADLPLAWQGSPVVQ